MITISLDDNVTPVLDNLSSRRLSLFAAKVFAESYSEQIKDDIDAGLSFTPRTGYLEQSTGWIPRSYGADVYSNAPYSLFVEFGTEPHEILPKNRKALKIPVGGALGYIIRKKANHPGSKAYPFFFKNYEARTERAARVALIEVMKKADK